jgi:hypothetical protein
MKKSELETKINHPNDFKLEDPDSHRLLKTAKKYHQNTKMVNILKTIY